MKTFCSLLLVAFGLLGILVSSAPAGETEDVYQSLIDAHAASIVKVKFVLSMRLTRRGQSQDTERSGVATGVLVDPRGLVVLPSGALKPRLRIPGRGRRPGSVAPRPTIELDSNVTSLRVVFPGDPKEYDAVLGATDSRLGLAFARIRDLEGKQVQAVDLEGAAAPKVGMRAYGVSRLRQGFDYAPFCGHTHLAAHVAKPRPMWLLQGQFAPIGHPLFDAGGRVLGFVVQHEGVGERGGLPFLLPIDVVRSTIENARREADKVLAEALESEKEDEESEPETEGESSDEE